MNSHRNLSQSSDTQTAIHYEVGSMVICPSHGVARVQAIQTCEIQGKSEKFYMLEMVNSGTKIMVPTALHENIRSITSSDDIVQIFSILQTPMQLSIMAWNRRFRGLSEKMCSISVLEVAEVLRDLWIIQMQKELSFNEKLLLNKTTKMLCEEISVSQDISYKEAEHQLRHILHKLSKAYAKMLEDLK